MDDYIVFTLKNVPDTLDSAIPIQLTLNSDGTVSDCGLLCSSLTYALCIKNSKDFYNKKDAMAMYTVAYMFVSAYCLKKNVKAKVGNYPAQETEMTTSINHLADLISVLKSAYDQLKLLNIDLANY